MKSLHSECLEEEAEDEQGWDNWLVESDSDFSSDESDWINVESDGSNDLELSDSDSEMADAEHSFSRPDQHGQPSMRVSSLATARVRSTPPRAHLKRDSGKHPLRYLLRPTLL